MSKQPKYLFVSVPSSITPSGHKDDAIQSLQSAVNESYGTVNALNIPEFKVGTLDALLQMSEELQRLEGICQGVVSKVGDTLKNILDGDEEKMAQHKAVNDKPLDQYLRSFSWNRVKYSADKPLKELIDLLQKAHTRRNATTHVYNREANSIDNDVRSKFNQYNNTRTTLQTLTRKQTGNLATKSLLSVVKPDVLISEDQSEHLQTHLVAVPLSNTKDFFKTYEKLCDWVVPRSAYFIAKDSEYELYAVTTFKRSGQEFMHKAREKKWVPRDYKFEENGSQKETKELEKVQADEKRQWGETLRLGRTGWSEGVICLIHVVIVRVFVETVLRYGLPLDFVAGLVKTTGKQEKRVRQGLDKEYSYLAGNAMGKDKKGRPTKDDANVDAGMQAAGQEEMVLNTRPTSAMV